MQIQTLECQNQACQDKYILVVVAQLTRQTWATATKDIQTQTIANAFEVIANAHGPPTELNTDEGQEFVNEPFQAVLRRMD